MSGGGMGQALGSFGTVPDMLMGKDPKDALLDNLKASAVAGTGMAAAGMSGMQAAGGAQPGTAGGSMWDTMMGYGGQGMDMLDKYGKPVANGLQAANQAQGLFQQQQQQQPPMQMGRQGRDPMQGLLAQQQETDQMRQQQDLMRRYGLLG